MLLALQWTAQNIAAFGGDPGRVTIQGESSGSVAVHLLMLSPQSSGLFWAAIGESNTALVPRFAPPDDPMILVHEVADAFNCSDDNATSIVDCLKQLDALNMAIGQPPYHLWTVVVENQTESNPEPFLTATPMQIVLSGDFPNIPWLMGHNSEEGADSFGANIMQQSGLDKVNSDFDSLSTNFFLNLSVSEDMVPEIWQRIADFYLGDNHTITLDNVLQLMHVYSDRYMAHQTHKANVLHTKAGKFPIYKYLFDYQGRNASEQLYYSNGTLARVGALHVDELLYLFNFESADIDWPEGHPDLETSRALVTLWTNFAAYCNPTPADADIPQGVQWPPIARNASHVTYYKISQAIPPVGYNVTPLTLSVQQDLYKDRMDFWDSLPLKENQGQ